MTGDRSLVEAALRLILVEAPEGWTRVRLELTPASPVFARASAVTASGPAPVAVPAEAVASLVEYVRGAAPVGRVVIEVDDTGALTLQSIDDESGAVFTPPPGVPARNRHRVGVWLWAVAVIAAAALLAVAITGRDRGAGPTLRPMAASESMSDEQARAVAESTVLVCLKERDAGHLANLKALIDSHHIDEVVRTIKDHNRVVAFGGFVRRGSIWGLNTHFEDDYGLVFVLQVHDGELRVYGVGTALVP